MNGHTNNYFKFYSFSKNHTFFSRIPALKSLRFVYSDSRGLRAFVIPILILCVEHAAPVEMYLEPNRENYYRWNFAHSSNRFCVWKADRFVFICWLKTYLLFIHPCTKCWRIRTNSKSYYLENNDIIFSSSFLKRWNRYKLGFPNKKNLEKRVSGKVNSFQDKKNKNIFTKLYHVYV